MTIFNVFTLLGGLAFFLYGMNVMGDALERKAGSHLKSMLAELTSNTFKSFFLGLFVTAVIQSSSATTVMVVGFVNSGIMTLRQAIGIILGANIGTSVTSWILSLVGIEGNSFFVQIVKPSSFTPLLAFIGIILFMFIKRSKHKDTALIFIGFAILMFGMETMSDAVKPLAESESFQQLMLLFSNPILGVLVGALMTAVIQSSSASVGILQSFALNSKVTYSSAIPIIMGQNIGTCVTAMISSIGAGKNAKRTAVVHLTFNILNSLLLLSLYCGINAIFSLPVDEAITPLGIAIVHSIFNILGAVIFLPLTKQLEKISYLIIKEDNVKDEHEILDERLLSTPPVAIERCRNIACSMAENAFNSLKKSMSLVEKYNSDKASEILQEEEETDKYEDMIGSYLIKLTGKSLSDEDNIEVSKLLHLIGDFERISDHACNLLESIEEMQQKELQFSDQAKKELSVIILAVNDILDLSLNAFLNNDIALAYKVEPLEQVVDNLQIIIKNHHIKRMCKKECTIELGFVFSDILTNLERVSDHCSNIAVCLIETNHDSMDMHSYLHNLKAIHDKEFEANFQKYTERYAL